MLGLQTLTRLRSPFLPHHFTQYSLYSRPKKTRTCLAIFTYTLSILTASIKSPTVKRSRANLLVQRHLTTTKISLYNGSTGWLMPDRKVNKACGTSIFCWHLVV